jgi:hypothetical protein
LVQEVELYTSFKKKRNLESKVPTVEELVEHFRVQANWKGPPPRYWIVSQKGIGDKIELKIEVVSPVAQELIRVESDVKRLREEGKAMPHESIFIRFKPQCMPGVKPSGKRVSKSSKSPWERHK